jgi:polyhydroxyalkanoate synthase
MIGTEPARAPKRLVHGEACLEVHRYSRQASGLAAPPVVIVYSFINRPTVLDLLPDRSVVRSLLAAGHDVFLVDWGNPGALESSLDVTGHLARLERAVRAVTTITGAPRVSVLGYCLGGTMSLLLGGLAPSLVDRIALLATPVVFDKGGTLALWAQTPTLNPGTLALTSTRNVPGELLRETFRWLDPIAQGRKWITLAEHAGDPKFLESFLASETWANDCVDFPGRLFEQLLVGLYREDRLARGELEIAGRPFKLAALALPILNVVADGDTIVPGEASIPLADLVGAGRVETLRVPGGHIGMTVGRRAPSTTHAALARFFGRVS